MPDWSETSRRFREAEGLDDDDPTTPQRFQAAAQAAFARRFTPLLDEHRPGPARPSSTTPLPTSRWTAASAPGGATALMTHAEIESLPSGQWGYQHFSRVARAIGYWGKPWLGMTGRFHKELGRFRRSQAARRAGVRVFPLAGARRRELRRRPTPAARHPGIRRLPAHRRGVRPMRRRRGPFYAGSVALPQFGNLCAGYPGLDARQTAASDEGAMLMAADQHRDVAMIDERADLSAFELVQLPDTVVITPLLAEKLRAYYEDGGNLLLSYRSGFDAAGDWALDFLPLNILNHGPRRAAIPDLLAHRPGDARAVGDTDRVCYMAGVEVLAWRRDPRPRRAGPALLPAHPGAFFLALPGASPSCADSSPAIVQGERFIYFADPIFREFRQAGNLMMRDAWHLAMNTLIGKPPFGDGLPKTILSVPRRRGDDLILTLLHYIPTRKAQEIDLIEERSSFAGETLRLPCPRDRSARLFDGPALWNALPTARFGPARRQGPPADRSPRFLSCVETSAASFHDCHVAVTARLQRIDRRRNGRGMRLQLWPTGERQHENRKSPSREVLLGGDERVELLFDAGQQFPVYQLRPADLERNPHNVRQ